MILDNIIPEEIIRKRNSWISVRDKWYNITKKEEEYYYGDVDNTRTNYDRYQLQKIEATSGISVTINYIHPLVNQKLAILVQNKPSHQVIAISDNEKHSQYAELLDKMKFSVLYNSSAISRQEETTKDMLLLGMGISGIFEKEFSEIGDFEVEYKHIHPSIVILDPNSKDRDNEDMEGFFIEKELVKSQGERIYSVLIEAINKKYGTKYDINSYLGGNTGTVSKRGKVLDDLYNERLYVSEYYDKVFTVMYFVKDINTGDILRLFEENLEEEQKFILKDAIDVEHNLFVRRNLMLGDKLVLQEIKPITNNPIKVRYFEWGGSPYNSYGMIHFIRGMQEAYDNTIRLMITNGILTNNAGYTYPEGSITESNLPKWEQQGNKPGIMKPYVPIVREGILLKPERENIIALSNFYPMLSEMLTNGMQFSTGINSIVYGDPKESNLDVFSSLKQYQSAAMQRINLALTHINQAEEHIGKVLIQYLLAYIKPNQNYIFFDNDDKIQEIKIAQDLIQDFKITKYKLVAVASEGAATQKISMSIGLMNVAQSSQDPVKRDIYLEEAYRLSDIKGFGKLREKIDTVKNLQAQLQQYQEQIERDKELIKQYENRALIAEYNAKKIELESNLKSAAVKQEMQLQIDMLKNDSNEPGTSN